MSTRWSRDAHERECNETKKKKKTKADNRDVALIRETDCRTGYRIQRVAQLLSETADVVPTTNILVVWKKNNNIFWLYDYSRALESSDNNKKWFILDEFSCTKIQTHMWTFVLKRTCTNVDWNLYTLYDCFFVFSFYERTSLQKSNNVNVTLSYAKTQSDRSKLLYDYIHCRTNVFILHSKCNWLRPLCTSHWKCFVIWIKPISRPHPKD